jgi:hypothetical protein
MAADTTPVSPHVLKRTRRSARSCSPPCAATRASRSSTATRPSSGWPRASPLWPAKRCRRGAARGSSCGRAARKPR